MSTTRRGHIWVHAVSGLSLLVIGSTLILVLLNGLGLAEIVTEFVAVLLVVGFSSAVVGWVVASRRPGHRIGRLLLILAVGAPLAALAAQYARYALITSPGSLPAGEFVAWLNLWIWVVNFTLFGVFLPLWFPTGHPPSPRWRWVGWLGAAAITLISLFRALATVSDPSLEEVTNPYALDRFAGELETLGGIGFISLSVAIVAALLSLIFRYRRAEQIERHQLKWILWAVTVNVVANLATLLLVGLTTTDATGTSAIVELFTSPWLVVAVGVAILKYRLYDIDVVISRSLVFGILAVFITGVYVGIVVGLGSLVGGGGEPNLGLSILATGLVAVLFEPVRLRAQAWANRVVFGRRASPYQVLAGLTARLGETTSDTDLLARLATSLGEGTGADATVWLRIGEGFRPAASSSGVLADAALDPEDSDLVVPVVHEEETLGLLTLTAPRGQQISPADERLVSDVAGNVGLMLRNVRLNTELAARADELAASRRRLVAVQDEERRRLERDLHDGAQQHVVAAAMQLNMAKMVAEREGHDQVAAQLGDLVELDQQAVEQLRTIARGIYPPLLEAEGLQAAICGAARSLPISVSVEADQLPRYPQDIEAAVYFCATETIRDALRRDADTARVILRGEEASVQVEITDVGSSRLGADTLQALTDRVGAVGGELDTTPTGVRIRLPVTERAEVGV